MDKRKLRDLEVSSIGIGCMGFSHGYGKIPEESYSIKAIQMAVDYGCTFFDTAEVYSPNLEGLGHNELIVGKALKNHYQNVAIATKLFIGTNEPKEDGSVYKTIRRHLEASLKRLQTEHVHLYYLHRVNPKIPVEDVAEAMGKLIKEGLIGGFGMSQLSLEHLDRAHRVTPVTAVQSLYNMLERDCEDEVFPYCVKNNIGIVPFSPVASGLLTGKITVETQFDTFDDVRHHVPQLKKENIVGNQPIVDLVKQYAAKKDATPGQIAMAWMMHKYDNCVPIPGSKNQERTIENLDAWKVKFTDQEFSELEVALNQCKVFGHRGSMDVAESVGDARSKIAEKKK